MSLPEYFRKMGGTTRGSPPRVSNAEIAWSWIGAFLGIAAAGLASQAVFAAYLNTSPSTVQKWEQGQKRPNGPSLKLLNLVAERGLEALA